MSYDYVKETIIKDKSENEKKLDLIEWFRNCK